MSIPKYVIVDVETGGIDPKGYDLLQVGALVLDKDLNECGSMAASLFPRDGTQYRVTYEAMEHNKIDLHLLAKEAMPRKTASEDLIQMLDQHYKFRQIALPENDSRRLIVAGWTPGFDVSWLIEHMVPADLWRLWCDYAPIDINSIAHQCVRMGLVPPMRGLARFAQHFGVEQQHRAIADCYVTRLVWRNLEALLNEGRF